MENKNEADNVPHSSGNGSSSSSSGMKPNTSNRKKINFGKIFTFGLNDTSEEYKDRIYVESKLDRIRLHAASVFFAGMYDEKRITMRYLVAFFSSIVYSVVTFFFVDLTGLYSTGTSGLFQGLARLISTSLSVHGLSESVSNDVYQGLFWGIWFITNIPLILFAWFRIGHRFTTITLTFVFCATAFGLLLSTPIFLNPAHRFDYFFLGNPLSMDTDLEKYNVYVLSWNFYPVGSRIHDLAYTNPLNGGVPNAAAFAAMGYEKWVQIIQLRTTNGYMDLPRVLSLFGYAALFALIYPLTIVGLYIIGGCAGGVDIPSIYWSDKSGKQLGTALMVLNTTTMVAGIILGSYITAGISAPDRWGAEYFFSPNLIMSLVYAVIGYTFINFYYPKYKPSVLKIYSAKPEAITNRLIELHYPHQLNVYRSIQLISGKEFNTYVIETVARYVEVPKIVYEVRKVDSDALLTVNMLHGIDGYLYMNKGHD